jgi:hypothetical protein
MSIQNLLLKYLRAHTSVLGVIPGTNIFENINVCKEVMFILRK